MEKIALLFSLIAVIISGINFVTIRVVKKPDSDDDFVVEDEVTKKPFSPYSVVISNTTDGAKKCILFGHGKYLKTDNFGSDEGIKVSSKYSNIDYVELLSQSAFEPFETQLIRIKSKNQDQICQIIKITYRDCNGILCEIPLIVQSYYNVREDKGMDMHSVNITYPLVVHNNMDLQFTVLGNTELEIDFFPIKKMNISNVLSGKNEFEKCPEYNPFN